MTEINDLHNSICSLTKPMSAERGIGLVLVEIAERMDMQLELTRKMTAEIEALEKAIRNRPVR